jgi:hypothetical protein
MFRRSVVIQVATRKRPGIDPSDMTARPPGRNGFAHPAHVWPAAGRGSHQTMITSIERRSRRVGVTT